MKYLPSFGRTTQGFTLVELLIVVAIIGVLSTIGVPTFKRMIQKAKKAEAKIALAGVYKAESGFFAEFDAYGTGIVNMGFEVDDGAVVGGYYRHSGIYNTGFVPLSCMSSTLQAPGISYVEIYSRVNAKFPAYYSSHLPIALSNRSTTYSYCRATPIDQSGATYTASSSGVIAPSLGVDAEIQDVDQWEINDRRELSNVNDGVR